jgi:V8-like Glu-specific endopeptidase
VVWSSPPCELDTTVLTLDAPVGGVEACRGTTARPRRDGKQRVYVIGHPSGRELSYSIDDNVLLDYDERVLHYRAPTEHGSSGSPVFNRDWEVLAVHHAGRMDMPRLGGQEGTYPANEGIWLEAVHRALTGDGS